MSLPSEHAEIHFSGSATLRDAVIGLADGLTVPFALAAGLTGAAVASRIVVTAGLAEIVAGSISMGLGGYLASHGALEHYVSERKREVREVVEMPREEAAEVAVIFRRYGLSEEHIEPIVAAFRARPEAWVDFMMRFELGLDEPDPRGPLKSAVTLGGAYAAGGLVPLAPFFFRPTANDALVWSIGVTSVALFVFGYVKGRFAGHRPWRGAFQTLLIGGVASAIAFALARAIS